MKSITEYINEASEPKIIKAFQSKIDNKGNENAEELFTDIWDKSKKFDVKQLAEEEIDLTDNFIIRLNHRPRYEGTVDRYKLLCKLFPRGPYKDNIYEIVYTNVGGKDFITYQVDRNSANFYRNGLKYNTDISWGAYIDYISDEQDRNYEFGVISFKDVISILK